MITVTGENMVKRYFCIFLFLLLFIFVVNSQSKFTDTLYAAARASNDYSMAIAKNKADISSLKASNLANSFSVSGSVQGSAGIPLISSDSAGVSSMQFPINAEVVFSLPQFSTIRKYTSLNELIEEYRVELDKSALNSSVFTIIGTVISYYKSLVNLDFYEKEWKRAEESVCAALGDREEELCTTLHRVMALQNLEEVRFASSSAQTRLKEYFIDIPDRKELELFVDSLICDLLNAPSIIFAKNEAERYLVNAKILEYEMLFVHPKIFTSGSIIPPDSSSLSLKAGVRLSLGYDPQTVQRLKASKDAASYYAESLKNTLLKVENQIRLQDIKIESLIKQAEYSKNVKEGAAVMGEIAKDKFEVGSSTMTEMFDVFSTRDAYMRDYEVLLLDLLYARAEKAFYCGAFGNSL